MPGSPDSHRLSPCVQPREVRQLRPTARYVTVRWGARLRTEPRDSSRHSPSSLREALMEKRNRCRLDAYRRVQQLLDEQATGLGLLRHSLGWGRLDQGITLLR